MLISDNPTINYYHCNRSKNPRQETGLQTEFLVNFIDVSLGVHYLLMASVSGRKNNCYLFYFYSVVQFFRVDPNL